MPRPDDDNVEVIVESDDEFEDSYLDPGSLSAEDVSGTVIYPLDWTVGTIVEQIGANPDSPDTLGIIVIDPPFQRRTAWNSQRQSLFIESLMLGLPIPPLVLAESTTHPGQFYVLDGKQRLTALRRFLLDDPALRLSGLELLSSELSGLTIAEIRASSTLRKYAQALFAQPIRTVVVRNWRTPSLLHLIFSRLNKAAVPLASHELRQALFPGRFTTFINQKSAEHEGVRRARRLSAPDFRLRDAETMLRYIALRTNRESYGGDLRQFLDRVLKAGNDHFASTAPDLELMIADLDAAVATTFNIFGDAAFLRYDPDKLKYMPRFNMAIFDAMTWHFSSARVRNSAEENAQAVKTAFEDLSTESATFSSYVTSTTKTGDALNGRIDQWGVRLSGVVGYDVSAESVSQALFKLAPKRSLSR